MIDNEIQSRMDAFRGNPQALMQRYAQSQQLLDLLALQKLKSEKEAAARQMQMQAGQGQMPTVAQQREQELMGMAKQEVAQRVGQVAQQQAKQQQENLQRAAQTGIAQAPAPNMMPPQAMASGGIVAFAGPEGSYVEGEDEPRLPGESDEDYLERVGGSPFTRGLKRFGKSAMEVLTAPSPIQNEEYARLRDLERNVLPQYSRGMFARMTPEQERAEQAVQNFYRQNKEQIVREPGLYEAFKRDPVGVAYGRTSTQREAVGKVGAPASAFGRADQSYAAKEARGLAAPTPVSTPEQYAAAGFKLGTGPGESYEQAMREVDAIPDPVEREAARAALQRAQPAAQQGIAQAAPAPQAAPTQQPSGLQAALEKGFTGDIQAAPEAAATSAEAAYAKRFDPLYQKQLELQQQGIASAQQLAERERASRDPLTAWLLGARGRTVGEVLGSAGRAGIAYQREALTRDQALQDQLQKLREAEAGAQVTQETARYGAGKEAAKAAREAREKAMQYGSAYAARSDVDAVRSQLNETRMQLLQQGIDDRRIAAAMATADRKVATLNKQLLALQAAKKEPATALNKTEMDRINREEAAIQEAMQRVPSEMLRLFGVNVPEYKAESSAPASGPAIPPPPPNAVRPKGAK